MLKRHFVAWYAHGRRCAALDSQQRCLVGDEATHLAVEIAKTLYQCIYNKRRQQLVQRAVDALSHIAAGVKACRRPALEEVGEALCRSVDGIASGMEGLALDLLLETKQSKDILVGHVVEADSNGYATIGKWRVAARVAHAVHHLLSVSCGSRHDDTAGTHTEAEDTVGIA